MRPRGLRLAVAATLALLAAGCSEMPATYPHYPPPSPPPRAARPAPSPRPPVAATAPATPAPPPQAPASTSEQDRGPTLDEIPPDLDKMPDAIVQPEPRSAWGNPDSYEALGQRYTVLEDPRGFHQRGYASWYGKKFHGKRTSSGEPYDMFKMTGAHKTLPIPCYVRITNLINAKSVVVRINDRGPFHSGRIVDLSYAAAAKLDMLDHGSTFVDLEVLTPENPANVAPVAVPVPSAPPLIAAVPPPKTQPGGEPHFLQAGVFNDVANAALFRDRLGGLGFHPLTLHSEQREGRWLYRVLVGPFANGGEMEAMRTRMNAAQQRTIPVVE